MCATGYYMNDKKTCVKWVEPVKEEEPDKDKTDPTEKTDPGTEFVDIKTVFYILLINFLIFF